MKNSIEKFGFQFLGFTYTKAKSNLNKKTINPKWYRGEEHKLNKNCATAYLHDLARMIFFYRRIYTLEENRT